MDDDTRADLDEHFVQARPRPVLDGFRQRQRFWSDWLRDQAKMVLIVSHIFS